MPRPRRRSKTPRSRRRSKTPRRSKSTAALDPHVRAHLLHGLTRRPELGYVVHAAEEGALHAIVVAPRESIRQRRIFDPLLRRHPDAVVWVAPQSTSRTGKTWHGRGWFPLTADEWSRLRDANAHQIFLSEYSITKKRQRDLVTALYGMLESDLVAR